jgi:hypothetical protein
MRDASLIGIMCIICYRYSEHLQAYDFALSQYLGSGCGMTYRGDRLYDSKGDPSVSTRCGCRVCA